MSSEAGDPRGGWGVWLHAVRAPAELADLAESAEALGAQAILLADEGTDRDLFVSLAAIAQRTTRVRLVGAVTNPHSRHPVATAAAWASLAELAPGRVIAGFGAGGSRVLGPMALRPPRPYRALIECVAVVDALLGGEQVDHDGEFATRGARLAWSPGRLPMALAGRGPRVERFAAERADWVLLAGRAMDRVAALVAELRAIGVAHRGRAARVAWNPSVAWTPALVDDIRAHLAYMVVDMPPAERAALGVDDPRAAQISAAVNRGALGEAARGVPSAVLERYAVAGERRDVVERLARLMGDVQPDMLLFEAGDYTRAYLESAAELASDVSALRMAKGA